MSLDVATIRKDFPVLAERINDKPLVYLDSANTSQKPRVVIDALAEFMATQNAPINRSAYHLAAQATERFESTRSKIAAFINAPHAHEVIFTKNATESLNLAIISWGRANLKSGDVVVLTHMEHHANIVPWQIAAERAGARVVPCPVTPRGEVDLGAFARLLSSRTRLVAFAHVSNALGTVNPAAEMTRLAKAAGAVVLIDGCQAAAHFHVDVPALGCDFYAFSGHKTFGPTGIGVLWGRPELLDALPPYQFGGDMIRKVDFAGTTYREAPERFEAGTPDISGAIALGVALEYLMPIQAAAHAHEQALLAAATERLRAIKGLTIVGEAPEKVAVISFNLEGGHPHDVGTLLDADGIAIRTGHHCCMPLMKHYGLSGTARASFAFYNTFEEVDRLAVSLEKARKMMA